MIMMPVSIPEPNYSNTGLFGNQSIMKNMQEGTAKAPKMRQKQKKTNRWRGHHACILTVIYAHRSLAGPSIYFTGSLALTQEQR